MDVHAYACGCTYLLHVRRHVHANVCGHSSSEREYSALSEGGGSGRVFGWLVVCGWSAGLVGEATS